MKRLLAFLLALMLPCAAFAETDAYVFEAVMTVDSENFPEYLTNMLLPGLPEDMPVDAGMLGSALSRLANGLGVRFTSQENAWLFELLVKESALIDFTIHLDESGNQYLLCSSLMPDYAIAIPYEAEEGSPSPADSADWSAAFSGAANRIFLWIISLDCTESDGNFSGDAYEGGVHETVWRFDDADLATLLSELTSNELQPLVSAVSQFLETDEQSMVDQLASLHQEVADRNEYAYVLRAVNNEYDELIGLSLTVNRGEAQVYTASIGFNDDGFLLVTGKPLTNANLWETTDFTAQLTDNELHLQCEGTAMVAGKALDYRAAQAQGELASSTVTTCVFTDNGSDGLDWTYASATTTSPAYVSSSVPAEQRVDGTGSISFDSIQLTGTFSASIDGKHLSDASFRFEQTEPISAPSESLITFDLEDMSEEAIERQFDALEQFSNAFSMRMIQLLPLDLILMLSNMFE